MRRPARKAGGTGPVENGLRGRRPRVYGSRPMFGVIIAVHVLVSLFLIFVILLQPGRADGMAAFGGGGGASSVFGGRGSVTFLAKVTEVCAAIFMITSLTLAYRSSHTDSVLRARRNMAAQEAAQKQAPRNPPLPTGQTAPAPATGGAAVPVPGDQAPGPAAPTATPPAKPDPKRK
jgi:preprotein translocase subunit SecG